MGLYDVEQKCCVGLCLEWVVVAELEVVLGY